jgi:hypothetical protein
VGAALAVSITASAQRVLSADEIAEAGAFDGQLYTNKALGLTILAPGGWAFYTYNQNQALVNANRTKNASAASANTQVLFQAMPPKGLGPGKTATLSAGVERLIKPTTAAVYSETNKKLLLTASPQLALTLDVKEEKHGDATFSVFEVSGKTDGQTYRQRYMATIRKGVAIFFVATFYDNKNEFAVEASLKTLKFGK